MPRPLDAVVVPTIRPWSLGPAIKLAREVDCALVILCTGESQASAAAQACGPQADHVLVTYLPASAGPDRHLFRTSRHPETEIEPTCHADIARKRNMALRIARLCGWQSVLFLDDDILDISAAEVRRAAALTARYAVAGFRIGYYPDNSVVCHAHRLAGGAQDVFPGGSAMAIDVAQADSLFPPIYNEDWMFLYGAVRRRSVTLAGTLSQLAYEPFANSHRAATEEFGEVIAEGLYWLLDDGQDVADATQQFWRDALRRRAELIRRTARQLRDAKDPQAQCALVSLKAARHRLAGISERSCLSFVRDWQADTETWRDLLARLPVLADLHDAAKHLNLPDVDRYVT